MSEWKKVKLGDCCEITSSKRCHASERSKEGIPFYCSKEIILLENGEEVRDSDFIPVELYESIKHKYDVPKPGDLLLTTRGTNGIPYIYKDKDCFYFADGNLSWFKNFQKELSVRYLYYWFKSHIGKHSVDSIAKGTAQKAVPIDGLRNLDIELPPFTIQHRIAAILSRYDSLIENYQKQIKLLEEAAQRLYKEWFVDLHFPGHENTKIVNGVPEGWEKKKAIDFFEMSIGKTPPRAEKEWFSTNDKDVPWVSISDMKNVMFVNETGEKLTQEACNKFNVKIVPEGTVLLSFKLTVGRVSIADIPVCTNEAIAHFMRSGNSWREYTLLYLRNYHYDSLGNTSGISKAVNSTIIKNMPFLMPCGEILESFSRVVSPIFLKIKIASSQIRLLTEARDRLLPKLTSGEIAV